MWFIKLPFLLKIQHSAKYSLLKNAQSLKRQSSGVWIHITDHISFIPLATKKQTYGLPLASKNDFRACMGKLLISLPVSSYLLSLYDFLD